MDLEFLAQIPPSCPTCLALPPLTLCCVFRREEDSILDGMLKCAACGQEFPVVDGLPLLVPSLPPFLQEQGWALWMRRDLALGVQDALLNAAGSGNAGDVVRQQLSIYASDHYGTEESEAVSMYAPSNGILALLNIALQHCPAPLRGPILDVGCSVGRTTFELARRTKSHVIGLDLNIAMLRMAREVAATSTVRFLGRRGGTDYQPCSFSVSPIVDVHAFFVVGDALQVPFKDRCFQTIFALNLLDCVRSPSSLIKELNRLLADDGTLVISTPFDWAPTSTDPSEWLGSLQCDDNPAAAFREAVAILGDGRLTIVAEEPEILWRVRLHDRSTMEYLSHLFVIRKSQ
ncbi:MAG: methyltransferase domain-containing protein [Planctomycetales bacterium]